MERQNFNEQLAYKKAQKRVKDIKNFYYYLLGFLLVSTVLLYKNYDRNIFNMSREHTAWMVLLWGIFLIGYGIYLFVPYFHNWEERKTAELMKKITHNKHHGNQ